MNKIEIGLKNGMMVLPSKHDVWNHWPLVAKFNYKLMQLGYLLNKDSLDTLSSLPSSMINDIEQKCSDYFENYLGSGSYKSLSNLVLSGDLFDSHMSLLSRWWWSQEWEPTEDDTNVYDFDITKLKVLKLTSEEEFKNIFTKLVSANIPLTSFDKDTIDWFINNYQIDELILPSEIPLKETLCMLASVGFKVPVKTPTDVLRIAAYMSGLGTDLTLPPKKIRVSSWSRKWVDNPAYVAHKFRKFTKQEKLFLLELLETVANLEEMKTKEGRWLRLFNMLDPQKFKYKFPKCYGASAVLRNQSTLTAIRKSPLKNGFSRNMPIITWKGKLDSVYKINFLNGLKMHKSKPGEFARSLDALIRRNPIYLMDILVAFRECAGAISNKVLFELLNHFERRSEVMYRKFIDPRTQKVTMLSTNDPLPVSIINSIKDTIWNIFSDKFAKLPSLGNVWLDPKLKLIPLPTNMKTLSDNLNVIIRGTRMPIPKNTKQINAYLYWESAHDLDLSMIFLRGDNETMYCSYRNLNPIDGIQHSGDIIPRDIGKWAEYVAIDIEKIKEADIQYGLMTTGNFSGESLAKQNAISGFQLVNEISKGTSWLPANSENSTRINSNQGTIALILFDFKAMEWITCDISIDQIPVATGKEINDFIKILMMPPAFSVYDLLTMHSKARGIIVDNESDADTKFNFDDFSKTYTEIIKYMI